MDITERSVTNKDGEGAPWRLAYFDAAEEEGRRFLNPDQHAHAVDLMEQLAFEEDPSHPKTPLDVHPASDGVLELRDKGGVLGKINLRIYFWLSKAKRIIFTLSAYKKEEDGKIPVWLRARLRLRKKLAESRAQVP